MPLRVSRISRSSSTTRTLCMGWGLRGLHLFRQRKLDDELRAQRLVFLDADGSAMVLDDAAHDGQSEARAALFGREVRQEQFFFHLLCDAVPGVGDDDFHR